VLSIVFLLLNSCMFNVVEVEQIPATLVADTRASRSFTLDKEVNVSLGTGFSRTLRAKTKWVYVGTTSYGHVYKTGDQVLTVEASHIHEAYIVVASSRLVGFYLPVEQSYSPLQTPTELSITAVDANL